MFNQGGRGRGGRGRGGRGRGGRGSRNMRDSQIPMNLPMNLFGNILNSGVGPEKGSW